MSYMVTRQFEALCDVCGLSDTWLIDTIAEGKALARKDGWRVGNGSHEHSENPARLVCAECQEVEIELAMVRP